MPVVSTQTIAYVIVGLNIDMPGKRGVATLRKYVDGVPSGDIEVISEGEDFMALVGATPAPNLTRGDDITYAVYNLAIAQRLISGAVV